MATPTELYNEMKRKEEEALKKQAAVQAQSEAEQTQSEAEYKVRREQALKQYAEQFPATVPAPPPAPVPGDTSRVASLLGGASPIPVPAPAPAPMSPGANIQEPAVAPMAPQPVKEMIKTSSAVQTSVTPGFKPSVETTRLADEAFLKQEQAAKLQAEAATERAQAEAKAIQEQSKVLQNTEIARQKAEEIRSVKTAEFQTNVDKAIADVDNFKVDPDKFFNNKGGFLGKLGAAFAVGLGAYASATTGGPNYALQIIDNAIERDLAAQRAELAKKQAKVGEVRGRLGELRDQFKDERLAETVAKDQQLAIAEMKLKEALSGVANKEAQARGQELLAGVQAKRADYKMKIEEMGQNKVTATTQSSFVNTQGALNEVDEKTADRALKLSEAYEKDPTVVAAREIKQQAKDFDRHIANAKQGNAESANALAYATARMFSGPGVLTDNDLKNASVSRGVLENIATKINKQAFGDLTQQELEAYKRLSKIQARKADGMIAQAGKKWLNKAAILKVPGNLVVSDEEEMKTAKEGPAKSMTEKLGSMPGATPRK